MNRPTTVVPERLIFALLTVFVLATCAPPPPENPPPTSETLIEITFAPTQNIDATATAYALLLIPSPTPAGLYIVQRGDTLSGLAAEFGTTVAEIMAANGLTDANAIQVGQALIIPSLLPGTPVRGTIGIASATPTISSTVELSGTLEPLTPTISTP